MSNDRTFPILVFVLGLVLIVVGFSLMAITSTEINYYGYFPSYETVYPDAGLGLFLLLIGIGALSFGLYKVRMRPHTLQNSAIPQYSDEVGRSRTLLDYFPRSHENIDLQEKFPPQKQLAQDSFSSMQTKDMLRRPALTKFPAVAGALEIFCAPFIFIFLAALSRMLILSAFGVLVLAFGLLGGCFAIQRRYFGMSVLGAYLMILTSMYLELGQMSWQAASVSILYCPVGIWMIVLSSLSLIFLQVSKKEFT